MPFLKFSVDSRLLEELGERLVGRPYIAVAELVKNSWDADSPEAIIELDRTQDQMIVSDTGQGMTLKEFNDYWMRVGSRHKEKWKVSRSLRELHRPLTGSKGIGRLAVQYLAKELALTTTSEKTPTRRLDAYIRWQDAVRTGNLTEARLEYQIKTSQRFPIGTTIKLIGLKQPWNRENIRNLAKEVWQLRPPFRRQSISKSTDFDITFKSPDPAVVQTFEQQMSVILDIWSARVVGKNDRGTVTLSLQFQNEEPILQNYMIPEPCELVGGDFDIRIYKLKGRQTGGITVGEARHYLKEFGGVHVYDAGFHLPYYGNPENDWLKIEFDHSHRLSTSAFLPDKLQIPDGMTFLPTISRLLGAVNVNTSKERTLDIAITRDRLQERTALTNLIWMTRYALDFYAVHEAIKSRPELVAERKTETVKFRSLEEVIDKHRNEIPTETYRELRKEIRRASDEIESDAELTTERMALVAPLATAGMTSLTYQHELKQQFAGFDAIIAKIDLLLTKLKDEGMRRPIEELKNDLQTWIRRAEMTNALFAYFRDAENVQTRSRFSAKSVVEEVWRQVEFLSRGATLNSSRLDPDLILPKASLLEWGSIFQNVFINAFNALVDSKEKLIDVGSRKNGHQREVLVQDSGVGVDLKSAEDLFQPFVRKIKLSPERRAMGYGGTGLGLTIVRLIARNVGALVSFVEPEKGFSTAFSLRWQEKA